MYLVIDYTADDDSKKSFKKNKSYKIFAIRDCTNLAPLDGENLISY